MHKNAISWKYPRSNKRRYLNMSLFFFFPHFGSFFFHASPTKDKILREFVSDIVVQSVCGLRS